ncbi:transmembrane protein 19 [Brevipalpus obovatus]|uniref:transmembrane protein 19 n=1 Tax=Brevipalpus obovatus TaxID=246614 RepID=UPI003D9DCC55
MSNNQPTLMLFVALLTLLIPISLSFWIISLLASGKHHDSPSPLRWFVSFIVPIIMIIHGYTKKHLDITGVVAAFIVGFFLTLSNYCFMTCMLAFFLTSSRATKYMGHLKRKVEADYEKSSRRNWLQVVCNGGIALQFALFYILERGIAEETPINFKQDYHASWFAMAVMGSIACCNGDTWASELGIVLSKSDPVLITTLHKVPKGTNGGVTIMGLILSATGGLVIGFVYYTTLLLCINRGVLAISPDQWPVIVIGLLAGLIGSIIDSLLGATLQYSGLDMRSRTVVENSGEHVRWISGVRLLDNHSVNLLSSLAMAVITPGIAQMFW